MWDGPPTMSLTRVLPVLLLSGLSAVTAACAGNADDGSSNDESNLDTSGCTGNHLDQTRGPVSVSAERPPTKSCWNIETGGFRVSYRWAQSNDPTPRKPDLGFWVSLNGAGTFVKASATSCGPQSGGISLGADTSGQQTYECTATAWVSYKENPAMVDAAYGEGRNGSRKAWDFAVAVALDSENHWDSLDGANYHFGM